jgi:hypothetical protein
VPAQHGCRPAHRGQTPAAQDNHRDGQLRVSSSVKLASSHQATSISGASEADAYRSTPHCWGPFGAECALQQFFGRVPCSAILPSEACCTQQRAVYGTVSHTDTLASVPSSWEHRPGTRVSDEMFIYVLEPCAYPRQSHQLCIGARQASQNRCCVSCLTTTLSMLGCCRAAYGAARGWQRGKVCIHAAKYAFETPKTPGRLVCAGLVPTPGPRSRLTGPIAFMIGPYIVVIQYVYSSPVLEVIHA